MFKKHSYLATLVAFLLAIAAGFVPAFGQDTDMGDDVVFYQRSTDGVALKVAGVSGRPRWATQTLVTFQVSRELNSVKPILESAWTSWKNQSSNLPNVQFVLADNITPNATDLVNTITVGTPSNGVASVSCVLNNNGMIVACDMTIGAVWNTLSNSVLEETLTHELGHIAGLPHSCTSTSTCVPGTAEDDATMRYALHGDGRGIAIEDWDEEAVEALYSCLPSETTLCLNGGRHKVTATWMDFQGVTGDGLVVPFQNPSSGMFYFFSSDNLEITVKVLNACWAGNYWVYGAAMTNVYYKLTVTDMRSGLTKDYINPLGRLSPAIDDTGTFPCN